MSVGTITRVAVDPHGLTAPLSTGDLRMTVTTVVGSSSYTTGGDSLLPSDLGLKNVVHTVCQVAGSASDNTAIQAQYIISTQLLQMFAATDASGCPYVDANSGDNLSGLTITITAFGY